MLLSEAAEVQSAEIDLWTASDSAVLWKGSPSLPNGNFASIVKKNLSLERCGMTRDRVRQVWAEIEFVL